MTSKSARSPQASIQGPSALGAGRLHHLVAAPPAGLHPARMKDDAVGQHAALALESLAVAAASLKRSMTMNSMGAPISYSRRPYTKSVICPSY